jgi:hypothetical protein
MPPISNDELTRFLQEDLNDREREFLDSLPTERVRREAERWYYFHYNRKSRERRDEGAFPRSSRGQGAPPGEQKATEQESTEPNTTEAIPGDAKTGDPTSAEPISGDQEPAEQDTGGQTPE